MEEGSTLLDECFAELEGVCARVVWLCGRNFQLYFRQVSSEQELVRAAGAKAVGQERLSHSHVSLGDHGESDIRDHRAVVLVLGCLERTLLIPRKPDRPETRRKRAMSAFGS